MNTLEFLRHEGTWISGELTSRLIPGHTNYHEAREGEEYVTEFGERWELNGKKYRVRYLLTMTKGAEPEELTPETVKGFDEAESIEEIE